VASRRRERQDAQDLQDIKALCEFLQQNQLLKLAA
jgi:hypothetical protein